MKRMIAFFLFSAFCCAVCAQEIRIIGRVLTPDSIPVAGAHIADEKSRIGTTSSENGFFALSLPVQKTALRFSHVAFYEKKVSLSESTLRKAENGGLWLDVVMEMRVRELPAAAISNSKVQIAWEDPKQWILDYELVGEEEMLLLLMEKNKRYLQLVNNRQEKIAQLQTKEVFSQLYKDCFGYFHLLSVDSACQIFLWEETFLLTHFIEKQAFDDKIRPIAANTPDYLYSRYSAMYNQTAVYVQSNKKTQEATTFIEVTDEKQLKFNASYASEIVGRYAALNDFTAKEELQNLYSSLLNFKDVETVIKNMRENEDRELFNMKSFYTKVLINSAYTTLENINDTLFFFDHLNGVINIYNLSGELLQKTPIDYHNQNGWAKEIIVNEERTRCFAKFTNVGETTLRELDPNTGKFLRNIVLEQHAFPSKIRVRGNYVYYRCRDYYDGEDRYFLWKQRIE